MICDYCEQPGVKTDCTDKVCCIECWELMKDWTLEKQAELDRLSKEVCDWLDEEMPNIKQENGLAPDALCGVCLSCRKIIQSDEHGNWYCDCHDERVIQ